ncbi:MAG: hypothetical protein IPH35_16700 [Rhodoferax sp.]|nr:hypothetical protein [Rhodoferax sp.]
MNRFISLSVACVLVALSLLSLVPTPARSDEPLPSTSRLDTAKVLLAALKRQNARTHAGKEDEIAGIEADLQRVDALVAAARHAEAAQLIDVTYLRTKTTIARMQPSSTLKSGSAALSQAQQGKPDDNQSSRPQDAYLRLEKTLMALRTAAERVAQERGVQPAGLEQARDLHAQAHDLAKTDQYREATARLAQAYRLVKAAVDTMLGGQEVFAGKTFATPSAEFAYEQQRNTDYQKLIDRLMQGVQDDAWLAMVGASRLARASAELAASAGQWSNALNRMEESTLELKKILRSAGFPIM